MPLIRIATFEDCHRMAPNLREADLQEIHAGAFASPLEALTESFNSSTLRFCIEHNGDPIAIFGVGPLEVKSLHLSVGVPWMLGTDGIKHHWVWFLRNSGDIVGLAEAPYDVLWNRVDIRNSVHIRWLKWCGFSFGEVTPAGHNGELFQEFMKTKCVTPPR